MKADTEILSGFYHSVNGFQKTDKKILKTVERLKIPVYNGCMEKGVNNMIGAIEGFRLPRYAQIPNVGLYLEQVVRYVNTHLAPLGEPELTSSMVSNYVKQGLISSPIKKVIHSGAPCTAPVHRGSQARCPVGRASNDVQHTGGQLYPSRPHMTIFVMSLRICSARRSA